MDAKKRFVIAINRILFPVDFSERCVGAARYVAFFAGKFKAELILLHVVDSEAKTSPARELLRSAKQGQLDTFLASELTYLAPRRVCILGNPSAKIVESVYSWHPDLVMMATRGLGSYQPERLGSVTATVLRDAECAVWTDIHSREVPPLEGITCKRVLCAIDLGRGSRRVLEWAAFLAGEYQASLGIVYATPFREAPPLAAEARAGIARLLADVGANATIFIEGGEPVDIVTGKAIEFHADLLLIGRHGGASRGGHLREHAHAILRRSPCPVISA